MHKLLSKFPLLMKNMVIKYIKLLHSSNYIIFYLVYDSVIALDIFVYQVDNLSAHINMSVYRIDRLFGTVDTFVYRIDNLSRKEDKCVY